MRIEAKGSDLVTALTLAASVAPRSVVIRSGDERATIEGYGDEMTALYDLPATLTGKAGDVVVPVAPVLQIAKEMRDELIRIERKGDAIDISATGAEFRVSAEPGDASEFPILHGEQMTLAGGDAVRAFESVLFAASKDESRYAQHGVLLASDGKTIEFVATDGRRLAISTMPGGVKFDPVILPASSVERIIRHVVEHIDMMITERLVWMRAGRAEIVSRVIDGGFPPYRDVIPKDVSRVRTIRTDAMRDAVKRAAIMTDPASKTVRIVFTPNDVTVVSRSPDRGNAEVSFEGGGWTRGDGEFSIHFNPDYVLDFLKAIKAETFLFEFTDEHRQAVMRVPGLVYVIMPVTPAVV